MLLNWFLVWFHRTGAPQKILVRENFRLSSLGFWLAIALAGRVITFIKQVEGKPTLVGKHQLSVKIEVTPDWSNLNSCVPSSS